MTRPPEADAGARPSGTGAAPLPTRLLALVLVFGALVYLSRFVPRGWVPHDEGQIAQAAELVLRGATPHVGYDEPYTGGLTLAYAALFKVFGIELLHLRWLLLAGASVAACLVYAICRRYLPPVGAALAVWVAVGWSFPNYFAGLPSWWLLVCALATVWAFIRYIEDRRWRDLAVAALCAGLAVTIKQTGVYLVLALALAVTYDGGQGTDTPCRPWINRLCRWGLSALSIGVAAIVLGGRTFHAEGAYLWWPVVACAAVLWHRSARLFTPAASPLPRVAFTLALAAIPLMLLLIPYAVQHRLGDFLDGVVMQPRRRLGFASASMPGAVGAIAIAVPLLLCAFACTKGTHRILKWVCWGLCLGIPVLALFDSHAYQLVWQSARALAPLLPIAIAWRLLSGRVGHPDQRRVLFLLAATLAWVSLNQFPFAAAIYFSYTTPLVVIAAVAAAESGGVQRRALVPWAVMLVLFAVLSTNRGFINDLGVRHLPMTFDTALSLPRAHLKVSAEDAGIYQRLVERVARELHGGRLVAGPDCPEVYFLAGQVSPTGTMYEFMSDYGRRRSIAIWLEGDVIVINHTPEFSLPLGTSLTARLRREFPFGEHAGDFEVRWR